MADILENTLLGLFVPEYVTKTLPKLHLMSSWPTGNDAQGPHGAKHRVGLKFHMKVLLPMVLPPAVAASLCSSSLPRKTTSPSTYYAFSGDRMFWTLSRLPKGGLFS